EVAGAAKISYANKNYNHGLTATIDLTKVASCTFPKPSKSSVKYNVYLDEAETPVNAEPIVETNYLLQGLALGTHTAGVEAVYTTGVSEMVTVEFELISETTYEITFSVVGANGILAASVNSMDISSGDLVHEGSNIEFIATPDENYRVKEWRFNDEVVDGHTTDSYTVSNLMAAANVTVEFEIITGVNTNNFANLKVYPNPFSDEIKIANAHRVNRVIITNTAGQRVMDINLNGLETIDTSELTNGVYLVTFEGTNGERTVRKMIKK
ncbi:MAG: T9SS type A sorting domain-containing protein, partial [Tenuifilaceae bacterium]|nr:T9SS type A sorting domain-containing protein [Tenuifilaceae bacterium]